MATPTLAEVRQLDKHDPLRPCRDLFRLPPGIVYLDGNSLGALPRATPDHLTRVIADEWGTDLIASWEKAGWMAAPGRVGAKIAPIIGADADEVVVADSTSVNLFKLLAAAVRLRPGRGRIVIEAGAFPTDGYVAAGVAELLPGLELLAVPPESLAAALDGTTAVLLLCDVHYRTSARLDMAGLTAAAHAAGALAIWDLSHSVGAVPVDLHAAGADMAVGCGYKFLNGGPGAPAFLFVARHLQAVARSPIQGWIGHTAPFAFADGFAPADDVARFLAGTPGVLGLAALECAVDLFRGIDTALLWQKSALLFDLFDALTVDIPSLRLLTPRAASHRGSHIAFGHGEAGALMGSLAARGVVGDYRPPEVIRFGLTPLYTSFEDIWHAAAALAHA